MMDSLLFSVRDAIQNQKFGFGNASLCDVMPDGHPKPSAGNWFAAVHPGPIQSTMMNALNEYYAFSVTLSRRAAAVPIDRVGTQLLASQLARTLATETGFNARAEQIRAFLHMNWAIIGAANNWLVKLLPGVETIYGFCEPARYAGADPPSLQFDDWWNAQPGPDGAQPNGIKAELRFQGARRLQGTQTYS